jgi:hypothetical protein
MDTQTEAQIYLSDQRGCSQADYFQSFHNFNFGPYFDESRTPFGALQLLNDTTLKPERSIGMRVEENTEVSIIPIVGGLEYKSDVANGFLEPGQVQTFSLTSGMNYEISNPYETELINYIEIWLITNNFGNVTPKSVQTSFDLQTPNTLLPLFSKTSSAYGFIGKFDGRQDSVYQLNNSANGVFVFVLSGAFEVQNRLLHERDGLAMSHIQDNLVDFEALSNEALIMLLEVPV